VALLLLVPCSPGLTQTQYVPTARQEPSSFFSLSLDELMELEVVTAARVAEPYDKVVSTITVITGKDLKSMGARTYHDALRLVPNVGVGRRNLGERTITMRGVNTIDSPGVLVMMDGHVLNAARTGSAVSQFLEELPIETIERIEVIHGPGSSLYGANAFLGVINIITKTPDGDSTAQADIRTEVLPHGDLGLSSNLFSRYRFSDDSGGLTLNLNWRDEDGHTPFVVADAFGRSANADTGQEYVDVQARLRKDGLELKGRLFSRDGNGYYGVLHVVGEGSRLESWGGFLEAVWEQRLTQDLEITTRLSADHNAMDNYLVAAPAGSIPSGSPLSPWNTTGYIGNPAIEESAYTGELELVYRGLDAHTLVGGCAGRYERQYDATFFANANPWPLAEFQDVSAEYNWMDDAHRSVVSTFVEDIWQVNDDLRLILGARGDRFSDFGTTVNPRVGLGWQIVPQLDLRLAYGTAFRAPSFGAQYVKNNPAVLGNPELNPETIATAELSMGYEIPNRLLLRGTYFSSELDDLIQTAPNEIVFSNSGYVTVEGMELEGRWYLRSKGTLRAFVTSTRSMLEQEQRFPQVPTRTAGFELNLPLSTHVNFNAHGYWQNESTRAAEDPRPDLDGYSFVNATLLIRELWPGAELSLSVFNVFDTEYAYPAPAGTLRFDYPAPPRSYVLSISHRLW